MKLLRLAQVSAYITLHLVVAGCAADDETRSSHSGAEAEQQSNETGKDIEDIYEFGVSSARNASVKEVRCKDWDGIVDGHVKFIQPCKFEGQVQIASSASVLDCAGGTIDGSRVTEQNDRLGYKQGIGVLTMKSACESSGKIVKDPNVSASKIINCSIRNFPGPGIFIKRRVWTPSQGSCRSLSEFSHKNELADYLEAEKINRFEFHPQRITIDRLKVFDNGKNGIFVGEYGRFYSITNSEIYGNGSRGIYLERESRENSIVRNLIRDNKAEGIAVDASAKNEILHNRIRNNHAAGISLFKNCGETHDSPHGVERFQHASHNSIMFNVISGHRDGFTTKTLDRKVTSVPGVGIYIGLKQGYIPNHADGDGCLDKPKRVKFEGKTYEVQLDYSQRNKIVKNTFVNNHFAHVAVHDDHNEISGNLFQGNADFEVVVGSLARGLLELPVRGTIIQGNKSESVLNSRKQSYYFHFGSTEANNRVLCNVRKGDRSSEASQCAKNSGAPPLD